MSSASAALALRPGVAQGACPERPDQRPPAVARALRAVVGTLSIETTAGRTLVPLAPDGTEGAAIAAQYKDGAYTIPEGADQEIQPNWLAHGITRNPGWKYAIPSYDEWYKAAYHDKTAGTAGTYFAYPTTSNDVPTAEAPSAGTNSANGGGAVGDADRERLRSLGYAE